LTARANTSISATLFAGEPKLYEQAPEYPTSRWDIHTPIWLAVINLPEGPGWLIEDLQEGFSQTALTADLAVRQLRQS
jgi:hypothetical protein